MFYNNLSLIQILLPFRAEHWEMDSQGQIKHTSSGEKESFYENVVSGEKRKFLSGVFMKMLSPVKKESFYQESLGKGSKKNLKKN